MKDLNLGAHKLADPRIEEIQYIHNFTEQFLAMIDTNPAGAKKIVHDVIRPYMAAQLRTISILEEQVVDVTDQNSLLLISNAELIHKCKENNVSMPNFDAIQRDFYRKKEEARVQAKAAGIIL